jgi:hypothetical protein
VSDTLAMLFELLGLMATLIVLGEPLRLLFSRFSILFRKLDFIETCVLNVYLGGLILYVLALVPLPLFDTPIILILLLLFATISIIYYVRLGKRRRIQNEQNCKSQKNRMLEYVFVLGMFVIALYVQIIPLASFVYGSIRDTSYHSLLAEVIIENRHIPSTLDPYLPEGIIYPQAAHVIFAFAAVLTSWNTAKAVFYVTPLFSALTVLGTYFLTRKLWQSRMFYLSAVFVSTFLAAWPMSVTWGANPFVVGLPLFLISSAMLITMLFDSGRRDKKELCIIGILFGYSGAIIISYLQTLLTMAAIGLLANLLLKLPHLKQKIRDFAFLFAISLVPISLFLFRFVYYYPNIGHNIGLPADFMGYPRVQNQVGQALQWAYENLSLDSNVRMGTILICTLSILLLFGVKRERGLKRVASAALLMFLASISLSLLSEVLPPDIGVVSSTHQVIIAIISSYLLVALFGQNLLAFLRSVFLRFTGTDVNKSRAVVLVSLLIMSLIYAPFVAVRLCSDPSTLKGAYGVFAVTSDDDDRLMLWIKENLSIEAVILVNQYEPGLFIPAVSNRKAIFATPGSQLSRRYQDLCSMLSNGTLNATCLSIMKSFGITHVYVGSVATYWWVRDYRWNPQLFLSSPNFRLIKRIGEAYLFQVSYENP